MSFNPLSQALQLAEQGFHVFPLQANGKLPAIDDFPNRATRDPEQIKRWWMDPVLEFVQPFNIGISTTKYNGGHALVVADVDDKNGKNGSAELARLKREGRKFPKTGSQITPTGGIHLVYWSKEPVKQGQSVLAPNIDIRSKGGYIVAVGSIIDGKPYQWKGPRELAECPQWIIEQCGRAPEKSKKLEDEPTTDLPGAKEKAIAYLKEMAPVAIEGKGGDQTTYDVAAYLRTNIGVTQQTSLEVMLEHWNGRCEPPWSPDVLQKKIENAAKYAQEAFGESTPYKEFEPVEISPAITRNHPHDDFGPPPVAEAAAETKSKYYLEPLNKIRPATNVNYLIKKLLNENVLAAVIGPSNVGKTFVAIDIAMSVAMAKPWNGRKVRRGAVAYIAAEAPGSFPTRLIGYRVANKIDPNENIPFFLISQNIDLKSSDKDAKALIAAIKELEKTQNIKISLIVLDTLFAAAPGSDENSPKDMSVVLGRLHQIRASTGAAVLTVHHMGKNLEKGARGHSSLNAGVDTEIHVKSGALFIHKQRDSEKGIRIPFRLPVVTIGQDDEGDPITTCVVKYDTAENEFQAIPEMLAPGSKTAQAYEALVAAGGSQKRIHITADWRKRLFETHFKEMKASAKSQAFKRAREELLALSLIEEHESMVTTTSQVHITSHVNSCESP